MWEETGYISCTLEAEDEAEREEEMLENEKAEDGSDEEEEGGESNDEAEVAGLKSNGNREARRQGRQSILYRTGDVSRPPTGRENGRVVCMYV